MMEATLWILWFAGMCLLGAFLAILYFVLVAVGVKIVRRLEK
jgi:hypothetical protein